MDKMLWYTDSSLESWVFLSLLGGMGEYLCEDDNTKACTKMDVAQLLVRTNHFKALSEDIEVMTFRHCINLVEETDQNKLRRGKNEEQRTKK